MPKCLRCGKCCFILDEKGEIQDCPNLIRRQNGKTKCKIYKERLYKIIGFNRGSRFRCVLRAQSLNDFAGCPYNTNKPILENR